jgi:hypothetical protein
MKNYEEIIMKVSKQVMIALLTVLMLSLIVTAAAAQSTARDTIPAPQGIVIVLPPAHKISDCNKNGIDDLDEFFPPDCYGKLTSSGGE